MFWHHRADVSERRQSPRDRNSPRSRRRCSNRSASCIDSALHNRIFCIDSSCEFDSSTSNSPARIVEPQSALSLGRNRPTTRRTSGRLSNCIESTSWALCAREYAPPRNDKLPSPLPPRYASRLATRLSGARSLLIGDHLEMLNSPVVFKHHCHNLDRHHRRFRIGPGELGYRLQ